MCGNELKKDKEEYLYKPTKEEIDQKNYNRFIFLGYLYYLCWLIIGIICIIAFICMIFGVSFGSELKYSIN